MIESRQTNREIAERIAKFRMPFQWSDLANDIEAALDAVAEAASDDADESWTYANMESSRWD